MTEGLADWWRSFADYSLAGYAPRYEAMVRAAADDPEVMRIVAAAPAEAHVPNNLHAAARFLLLNGADHPVSRAYDPGDVGDLAVVGEQFCDFVRAREDEIAELLATRVVQTNEVNRTAAIAPSLGRIAAAEGRPIALVDIGCSAGLNLLIDRYRITMGGVGLGPADARLRIDAENRGAPIGTTPAEIGWRRGVDRSPVDVTDADAARWLEALVWPDQPERRDRLRAAIAEMEADPQPLVAADALDGLRGALADAPEDLLVVIVTTWVVFYFDEDLRRAFDAAIVGADRPTAWLAMEMAGVVPGIEVPDRPADDGEVSAMTLVRGGGGRPEERSFLGHTHPHGAWVAFVP